MINNALSSKRLKELIKYLPLEGIFIWKESRGGLKKGAEAGCISQNGYRMICIDNIRYRASRISFLYMEGYFPEGDIDHINRIKTDDRWDNLRHVSRQCNSRNCGLRKTNKSGITGVWCSKRDGRWLSQITIDGIGIHLGVHPTKELATLSRWKAEKEYNFPNCISDSPAYLYLKERKII